MIPVVRILHDPDSIIDAPGVKLVGAAGREGGLNEPAIAMSLDEAGGHDRQRGKAATVEKVRHRGVEFDFNQGRGERPDADLLEGF